MKINAYLPNPRDKELDIYEYYVLDTYERVQKVYIFEINPCKENTLYNVRKSSDGKIVHSWNGERGFAMGYLYDNKIDCKNHEHDWYDGWKELRRAQNEQ